MTQDSTLFVHLYDWTLSEVERHLDAYLMLGGYHFDPADINCTGSGAIRFVGRRHVPDVGTSKLFVFLHF